jgi:hypothetical protein
MHGALLPLCGLHWSPPVSVPLKLEDETVSSVLKSPTARENTRLGIVECMGHPYLFIGVHLYTSG